MKQEHAQSAQHPGALARYLCIAVLSLWIVTLLWSNAVGINYEGWLPLLVFLGVMGTVWLVYGPTGRSARIADMAQFTALWKSFAVGGCLLNYCLAVSDRPLYDASFVQIDAIFGFNWLDWFNRAQAHPRVYALLGFAYQSLPFQVCFALMYFAHFHQPARNRELLWIALVSCVITAVIAGLFPARGSFEYFGVPQYAGHLKELTALRTPGPDTFAIMRAKGIVTMPSYHTAAAIFFTYVFRGRGWLFWGFALLNGVMLPSVITHGGHYLFDAIAGAFVAVVSIAVVRWMQRAPESASTALLSEART